MNRIWRKINIPGRHYHSGDVNSGERRGRAVKRIKCGAVWVSPATTARLFVFESEYSVCMFAVELSGRVLISGSFSVRIYLIQKS